MVTAMPVRLVLVPHCMLGSVGAVCVRALARGLCQEVARLAR